MTINVKGLNTAGSAKIKQLKGLKKAVSPSEELNNDLPLSGEYLPKIEEVSEIDIDVMPPQEDEFICSECFLVKHKSQLGEVIDNASVCKECL
ncbi:MAG: DUF4193 domain-containing protein [Bifidobacteriaceae bacterium]|jgi:hypothetical protein|nr:DUF4193 domain-containing protein [Bifidobacteriaceae bacterium]